MTKNSIKISDENIAKYSGYYVKMRAFSVHALDGWIEEYDKRNNPILYKYQAFLELTTGLSIHTEDRPQLQCLRYLAMRELASRETKDNRYINIRDTRLELINEQRAMFDSLAENPYAHHSSGLGERFLDQAMVNKRARDQEKRARVKALKNGVAVDADGVEE